MVSISNKSFDIRQTNIAKGIACLLLLFHHLFSNTNNYSVFLYIDNAPLSKEIAIISKICVSMFLILSGYGVSVVIEKHKSAYKATFKNTVFASLRQLWKLWANYACIFVLFVPWQPFFNHFPYNSWIEFVIDFSGLAYLFKTTTINATWWYMTIAILAYALTPFFEFIVSKNKILSLALSCVLYTLFVFFGGVFWVSFYFIGYIIGKTSIFEMLAKYKQAHKVSTFFGTSLILVSALMIRYIYPLSSDLFLALSIICFSYLFLSEIRFVSYFLELLGKHSGNIFMFHTFIYSYDFKNIVYAPKYVPFIFTLFVLLCLFISIIIEFIKKYTLVNRFTSYISNKILSNVK